MAENINNINWYPGHMKKTRELIQQNLKLVDLVIEMLDARIPVSSRNPVINEITGNKRRIVILNKSDLADEVSTKDWIRYFKEEGLEAVKLNCDKGLGFKELYSILERIQDEVNADRKLKKPLRMMVVGVPNVGKSSFINRLTGRKSAKTGDKPGVTRGKQWLSVENGMQLLDTPGILWPKFEDPKTGMYLAFCGSIKDEILDVEGLGLELIRVLSLEYPELLTARYKIGELSQVGEYSESLGRETEDDKEAAIVNMEAIALKRGFILPGKRINYTRTAETVLDEFRAGTIGRMTLEKVK
ncbi:MAG: ribosome biogenesis GTPase YlqF [Firmicutes bacterium]|nr:ribosome biogenesis GTPase YlqF [Bacillota bacterium]